MPTTDNMFTLIDLPYASLAPVISDETKALWQIVDWSVVEKRAE